jgi:hypothetical protein
MFVNILRAAAIAVTITTIGACDNGTAPAGPDVATLTLGATTLPANGEATTTVSAMIPPGSRVEPRQVTFSTTAGTFSGQAQHVTVPVDPDGKAVAVLKASSSPTLALVSARAGETTLQDSVRFVVAPATLQSFTLSAQTVPADGETTITLRAVAPPTSTAQLRQITFHSSAGTFVNGSTDSVVVTASGSGEAVAVLKAPSTPALAVVRARAGVTVLQDTIRFHPAPPQIQALTMSAREVPADGASTITLRAVLSATSTSRTVRFGTSAGVLLAATARADTAISVPADPAGVALVLLEADTALGVALVRASAGATTLVDTVRFVRALPDQISLSADSFRVLPDPARPLMLTATLTRSVGHVTRGAVVEFTATRPDGTSLGWFGGTTTSSGLGTVSTRYTPGTTSYQGPVIITARTMGASGGMISANMTVEVRSGP